MEMFLHVGIWLIVVYFVYTIIWSILRRRKVLNLNNKYVLITGCDTGFGNLLAKRLDKLGLHVFAACYQNQGVEEVKRSCSSRLVAFQMDVSNETKVKDGLEFVEKQLPANRGLWAVVNNAGIVGKGDIGPVEYLRKHHFEEVISVNLYGVIMVTMASLDLIKRENGRIVNVASLAGRIGIKTLVPYSVSKFGVEAFSDCLRRHLYKSKITVHLIEPTYFATSIIDDDLHARRVEQWFADLPEKERATVPLEAKEKMLNYMTEVKKIASPNLHLVIDAMEHAITAEYPRIRYMVGTDARFIYRPLLLLPDVVNDFVLDKLIK